MLRLLHPGALCRFSLSSNFSGAHSLALLPPTSLPLSGSLPLSSFSFPSTSKDTSCYTTPVQLYPTPTKLPVTSAVIFRPNRSLSTSPHWYHGHDEDKGPGTIPIIFILKDGTEVTAMARDGEIALRLAQRYDVPMEGACEASLACTTCHCYVEPDEMFDQLPEATETEEDLLDQAPFLDVNSRLGCQLIITPAEEGLILRLPRATANFYVDGHVPQPH